MRKRIALLSLAGLVSLGAIVLAAFMTGNDVSATGYYDLIAGNRGGVGENVGEVAIWNTDTDMTIQYSPDSPWCLTEVHVCVTTNP